MATYIKKIIAGVPIKKVTSGAFTLYAIDGTTISGGPLGHGNDGDLLVYNAAQDTYVNTNTLTGTLNLDKATIGDITLADDSISATGGIVYFANPPQIRDYQEVFNDSDITTKYYVDGEIDKVRYLEFTTDDNFIDSVHIYDGEDVRVIGGTGLTSSAQKIGSQYRLTLKLDDTTVTAGTYGSGTEIPTFTVDSQGRITDAGVVDVAGVSSIDFDSSSGRFIINTADGNVFSEVITLDPYTTADLVEDASNQYYTRSRFDSALGDATSISTIRGYFSTSGDLEYDSATGQFSVDVTQVYTSVAFDSDLDAAVSSSNDLEYDDTLNTFNLKATTVTAGSYGSSVLVPTFTVDSDGRLQAASEVSVAGVDSTSWDSASGQFTINTADGGSFAAQINGWGNDGITIGQYGNVKYETYGLDNNKGIIRIDSAGDIYGGSLAIEAKGNVDIYAGPNIGPGRTAALAANFTDDRQRFRSNGGVKLDVVRTGAKVWGGLEVTDSVTVSGPITVSGDVVPSADSVYDLGDSVNRWKDLYLSGQTIYLGTLKLTDSLGNLKITTEDNNPIELGASSARFDSAFIGQLTVDSVNMTQVNATTADFDTLSADQIYGALGSVSNRKNVTAATIDAEVLQGPGGFAASATETSANKIDVGQLEADSTYTGNLNALTADIDTAELGQVNIDSVYATQINTPSLNADDIDADSVRATNLSTTSLNATSTQTGYINLDNSSWTDTNKPNTTEGVVWYNSGPDALMYQSATSSPIKVNQEDVTRVYNNTGAQIDKGTVVYVTGAANDFPTIAKARADNVDTVYKTLGLTRDNIPASSYGLVITRGLFGGLDTQTYSVGDIVHVDPDTAGALTTTNPVYPNYAVEVGTVLVADSALGNGGIGGCIQVIINREVSETLRVSGDGRIDNNLTIGGNLNVLGTETRTAVANLNVADTFIYLGGGNTIGAGGTNFGGTGDQNATFTGHFTGDSDETFRVRISQSDAGGDYIEWTLDSTWTTLETFDSVGGTGPTEQQITTSSLDHLLKYGIYIEFDAATGHDVGDSWNGDASPINVQIGISGNYNEPDAPYAHGGVFRDIADGRWKFFEGYVPEPEGNVNTADASFSFADVQGKKIFGTTIEASTGFTGNVTGTVSDISNHNTSNLAEDPSATVTSGTMYYTDARVHSAVADSVQSVYGRFDSAQLHNIKVFKNTEFSSYTDIRPAEWTGNGKFAILLPGVGSTDDQTILNGNRVDIRSGWNNSAGSGRLYLNSSNAILQGGSNGTVSFKTNSSTTIGTITNAGLTMSATRAITADSATIGQFTADSVQTSRLDVDSAYIGQLDVDSASIGNFEVSGNAIKNSNDTFSIENRASATKKHINIDNYSQYGDISLRVWNGGQLRTGVLVDGDGGTNFTSLYAGNGQQRLATRNLGVTIYGSLDGDSATFNGNVDAVTFSGNGSSITNVNAAQLSSLSATSFLRSDAADIKTSGDLTFNDNINLQMGSGADLVITHNGTNSYISNNNGELRIENLDTSPSAQVVIGAALPGAGYAPVDYFRADASTGEAVLYHNGFRKINTDSYGVEVTGRILADSATIPKFSGQTTFGGSVTFSDNIVETATIAGVTTFSSSTNLNLTALHGFFGKFISASESGTEKFSVSADGTVTSDGSVNAGKKVVVGNTYFGSSDSATTDYRIEQNTVSRTYKNTGLGDDSSGNPIINLYFRSYTKSRSHRYYGSGSTIGYYVAYDSDGLRTSSEMEAPHLDMVPGRTYRFHYNDSSMNAHDIRFYYDTERNEMVDDSSTTYVGFAGNKKPGLAYAQITVAEGGPQSLAYQCLNHPYMGNAFTTNSLISRVSQDATGVTITGNLDVTGVIDGGTF